MSDKKPPELTIVSLSAKRKERNAKRARTFEDLATQVERLTERVHDLHGRVHQQTKIIRKLLKGLKNDKTRSV